MIRRIFLAKSGMRRDNIRVIAKNVLIEREQSVTRAKIMNRKNSLVNGLTKRSLMVVALCLAVLVFAGCFFQAPLGTQETETAGTMPKDTVNDRGAGL